MKERKDVVGLIPAAGKGTRLYPFSRAVPKELYPILGKAVIEHSIENLRVGGVKKVFIVVGDNKGVLMDYVGDGSFYGVDVAYVYQLQKKGNGHAILQGKGWINETFVSLFGDSFIEPKEEINTVIDVHLSQKPLATIVVFEVETTKGYGIVKLNNVKDGWGEVDAMVEKPGPDKEKDLKTNGKFYAFVGLGVFEPGVFDYIERTKPDSKGEIYILDALVTAMKAGEKINAVILKGRYLDIGKWKTVLNVEKYVLEHSNLQRQIDEREAMAERVKKFGE